MELNQLTVVEKMSPAEIFTSGKVDDIIKKIQDEARAVKTDISTDKGRKEVASLAYRIARSKTFLDDLGKKLGEDAKARLDAINSERKTVRDQLDALKDEVRKPLTEWENAEKDRIAGHEAALVNMQERADECERSWQRMEMGEIQGRLAVTIAETRDWQEFKDRAMVTRASAIAKIERAQESLKNHLALQEELAKMRAAEAERAQKERDDRIRQETEQRVRHEAEAKAKAEAQKAEEARLKVEREKADAERRAEAERQAKIDAENRAKEAEQRAVENERRRAEEEAARLKAEEEKRERNRKHVAKINNEIVAALTNGIDLTEAQAKQVVKAIAMGTIPNTKISY